MVIVFLECGPLLSLACNATFADTGSSDPTSRADIHKLANHRTNRRGTANPNAEIGLDPAESVRSKSDIHLTIHDRSSRANRSVTTVEITTGGRWAGCADGFFVS